MTDSTTITRVSYTGDGSSTNFTITFPFYLATDILVQLAGATVTSGYSISGGNGSTGTLTMATPPAAGVNVQAILNPPLTQSVNLVDGTSFPSATLNQVNDRAVQIGLRLQDQINRSIRAPDGDSSPVMLLPTAANRAGKALMLDSNGNVTIGSPSTQVITTDLLAPFLNLQRTTAEIAAAVTPTNYAYVPGDLRRYGATLNGDITLALTSAAAQSQQAGGSPIYIPHALGTSCTVTAGVTFSNRPVLIYGDNYGASVISTSNDITIFSFTLASSQSNIRDLQLTGKGVGATQPAIIFTNSNFNQITRCYVHSFGVGVRYVPGVNSSYLNVIRDSQIVQNILINIDAQKLTNALQLFGVTFGGGNSATGLKFVDGSNLLVSGFDCEGCSSVGIDIDNPTVPNLGGHIVQGGDIEGGTNTFSSGAIRLGVSNINPVLGVVISGINSAAGGSDDSLLNAINCAAVDVRNIFINSGFAGPGLIDGWLRLGANAKNVTTGNVTTVSGTIANLVMPYGIVCDGLVPLTGAALVTPNGGLIATANLTVSRVAPAGNITGVVLQSGTRPGQRAVVINESAFTITFAVAGTSAVADGTLDQILSNTAREFTWDTVTSLWYRKG